MAPPCRTTLPHFTETLTLGIKLALHVVLSGDGGSPTVVVNMAKGPCAPNE